MIIVLIKSLLLLQLLSWPHLLFYFHKDNETTYYALRMINFHLSNISVVYRVRIDLLPPM
jgi:hypothetical protein